VLSFFELFRPSPLWIPLLYLGILSSVATFFLLNYMLGRMEAIRTAVYANLTSVISVTAGVLMLGEGFRWYQMAGTALVLLGV